MAVQPVAQTDWNDYTWFLKDYIPKQTVPVLKNFVTSINFQAKSDIYVRSSDRKQDIVNRIQDAFQRMKATNDLETYARTRMSCERQGVPLNRAYERYAPPPTFGGVPAPTSHQSHNNGYNRPPPPASNGYNSGYNAAGPSRVASSGWTSTSTTTAYSRPTPTMQDWKPNPMWRPIKALTPMETLPDISHNENSHVRREKRIHLTLPQDVIEKMNQSRNNPNQHTRYAVRLFCTSSDHYRPPGHPLYPGQIPPTNRSIPIEFPANPHISVDHQDLSFKEKGLRGKAGSAPPFDLEKGPGGLSRAPNKITYITFGHSGPTVGKKKDQAKRFFYQVVFTEMTTKEELLRRLEALEPTSAEAAQKEFLKRQEEDDDIVVGSSVMSLKDPLAYMRITRPVRSSKCRHLICFDARWWIESNAQHPQWLCPHCGQQLRFPELIVDGFFLSILNAVPDSVDEVVLESNGEWHTEDKKYGSRAWMAENGTTPAPDTKPDVPPSPRSDGSAPSADGDTTTKRKIVEILSDSEDDDEDGDQPLSRTVNGSRPPPPASPAPPPPPTRSPPAATVSSARRTNDVIDLTLSDSDDDDTADEQDEPSSSATATQYFQPPGAGYATRNAVDSHPPPLNKNENSSAPQNQYQQHGAPAARQSHSAGGGDGGLNGTNGAEGPAALGHDRRPNESTSYSQDLLRALQARGPPRPSPTARTALAPSPGYGGSSGTTAGGSVSKRPRADDWMDTGPDDPAGETQAPQPHGARPGNGANGPTSSYRPGQTPTASQASSGFATYSSNQRAFTSDRRPAGPAAQPGNQPGLAEGVPRDRERIMLRIPAASSLSRSQSPNLSLPLPSPRLSAGMSNLSTSSRPGTPHQPGHVRQEPPALTPASSRLWVAAQNASSSSGDMDLDDASAQMSTSNVASPVSPTASRAQPSKEGGPGQTASAAPRSLEHGLGGGADGGEEEFWEGLLNGDIELE
ncbi:hypothetical protein IAU60_003130 [Kwoniella sp. DSM 27419]